MKVEIEIDEEIYNEFKEVEKAISTEEEPFDAEYWIEVRMKEFVDQQKQTLAWKNYGKI